MNDEKIKVKKKKIFIWGEKKKSVEAISNTTFFLFMFKKYNKNYKHI